MPPFASETSKLLESLLQPSRQFGKHLTPLLLTKAEHSIFLQLNSDGYKCLLLHPNLSSMNEKHGDHLFH